MVRKNVLTLVRKNVAALVRLIVLTLVRYNDGMYIVTVWVFNLLVDRFTDLLFYQLMGIRVNLSDYRLIDFVTYFDIWGKRVALVAPFIAATGASWPEKFGGNIKIV